MEDKICWEFRLDNQGAEPGEVGRTGRTAIVAEFGRTGGDHYGWSAIQHQDRTRQLRKLVCIDPCRIKMSRWDCLRCQHERINAPRTASGLVDHCRWWWDLRYTLIDAIQLPKIVDDIDVISRMGVHMILMSASGLPSSEVPFIHTEIVVGT